MPEAVIDLLAWQWHVDFYEPFKPNLSLQTKRELVKSSIRWHRKKGTPWAVKEILRQLGFKAELKEWFELPAGAKPHTFSITGYHEDDPYNIYFLGKETEALLINAVYEAKAERSHLLFLVVAPPPVDRKDHRCRWDYCTWDHGVRGEYKFDLSDIDGGFFPDTEIALGQTISRADFCFYRRGSAWDAARFDEDVLFNTHDTMGRSVTFAIIVDIDDNYTQNPPRPKWSPNRTWRNGSTWQRLNESTEPSTDITFRWED